MQKMYSIYKTTCKKRTMVILEKSLNFLNRRFKRLEKRSFSLVKTCFNLENL
jgi:hypothetical protein